MRLTLAQRLAARQEPCACGCDCIVWTGKRTPYGYGFIWSGPRRLMAHRVAWELEVGPIPDGLVMDHVRAYGCIHRHCVNIAHLEPVTNWENLLRGDTITAACAAKTHCKHGHPFDELNTYRRARGDRECRACHRNQERTRKARRRLAPHRDADAA